MGSATGPAGLVQAPGARQRGAEQIADNWHDRRGSNFSCGPVNVRIMFS